MANENWHFIETFKRCKPFLVEEYSIPSYVHQLADRLFERGYMTYTERQDIQETPLTSNKMRLLIDTLIKKENQSHIKPSYECCLETMMEHGREDMVNKLNEDLETMRKSPQPQEEDIPETVKRIMDNIINVPMSEIHRCLGDVLGKIFSKVTTESQKATSTSGADGPQDATYRKLIEACGRDDGDAVEKIISQSPECVNYVNADGETLLMVACSSGKVNVVKAVLRSDSVDVNMTNKSGKTALMNCLVHGNIDVLSVMLDSDKIDLSVVDNDGLTYLQYIFGHEIAMFLVPTLIGVQVLSTIVKEWTDAVGFGMVFEVELLAILAKVKQLQQTVKWDDVCNVIKCLLTKDNVDHSGLLAMCLLIGNADVLSMILQSGKGDIPKDVDDGYEFFSFVNPGITQVLLDYERVNLKNLTTVQVEAILKSVIHNNCPEVCASVYEHVHGLGVNRALETVLILQSIPPGVLSVILEGNKLNFNDKDQSGNTVFSMLCKYGPCRMISKLLERNDIDFNVHNRYGQSCFQMSLMNSDKDVPKLLLDNDHVQVDVNHLDNSLSSALSYACASDNEEIVNIILSSDTVTVNQQDVFGFIPMSYVCVSLVHLLFSLFINHDPGVNLHELRNTVNEITSVMKRSVKINSSRLASTLMKLDNIDLSVQDQVGQTVLMLVCLGGNVSVVSELLQTSIDKDAANMNGYTALTYACFADNPEIVSSLLMAGASVDLRHKDGATTLTFACSLDNTDIVRLLLDAKADVSLANDKGITPLIAACNGGNVDIVKLLIEAKADINASSLEGLLPITFACDNGHTAIVELLLEKDANVNAQNSNRHTPLMGACAKGNEKIFELLMSRNAEVNICDDKGNTPLLIACGTSHTPIATRLLQHTAAVNIADSKGTTPLMLACDRDNLEIVKLLLTQGAKVNVADEKGRTPLYIACCANNQTNDLAVEPSETRQRRQK